MASRGRPPFADQLTPAEWRVANAVRHGGTNREVAARLGVTVDAVKFQVASITGKLGIEGRAPRYGNGQGYRKTARCLGSSLR